MEYELWAELRDLLIARTNEAYHWSLKASSMLTGTAGKDRKRAIQRIRRTLQRGRPVLAYFGGALDHYSVLCGYTDDKLFLFDSSRLSRVQADNVGLGERSPRRYWLLPASTITLFEDW
jgi:hypothetical protein